LKETGLVVKRRNEWLSLRDCVLQPINVIKHLLPSLRSLKEAVCLKEEVSGKESVRGFVTLDYAAYELTKYQEPRALYVYPDDFEKSPIRLRGRGFVKTEP